jgi:hypothetical protein
MPVKYRSINTFAYATGIKEQINKGEIRCPVTV